MKKGIFFTAFCIFFLISSVYSQLNINFLGQKTYTPELSDIWGHVDSLGNEYALVGVNNALSVVDVTDPANPNEIWSLGGASSTWRDIKTWNNHAYVTNESNGGLFIVDLSGLPNTAAPATANFTGVTYNFTSAHNLYIDENGICYIFGSNNGTGGAIILDLTADPMNPVELGRYNDYYLHDGMARGDTLWGAAVNDGFFTVVDVSDKANPVTLAVQNTPSNFTHNCWISDDGNYLYTTDEVSSAFIASYDVSDLGNIVELDRIRSNPGTGTIPHNAHFWNNYVITSYYRDGVTIHDVTDPSNMIEVGSYDTSPQSGNGFNGAWGVYPWLPSGNLIVSDIENGLFILGTTYIQGCYLEGVVTETGTGSAIPSATVLLISPSVTTSTDLNGNYATGIADSGTYQVAFSAPGYISDTLSATLSNGLITVLNANLDSLIPFSIGGQVVELNSGNPIANADVRIENTDFTFDFVTDSAGNFALTSVFEGNYEVVAGKWGYITACFTQWIDSNTTIITVQLDSGLYDDFTFDFGWTVASTAGAGVWERDVPNGTQYGGIDANPPVDVNSDCFGLAYVTGNQGVDFFDDDVDDGSTILTSPFFDLSSYTNPYLSYYRWFFNDGGVGTLNDTLFMYLDNGSTIVTIEKVSAVNTNNSTWIYNQIRIADYITPTATMQLTAFISDMPGTGHLVEGGIDKFQVTDNGTPPVAGFTSSTTNICVGSTVQFTDTSTNVGSTTWYFDGGTPDTVVSQSTATITYNTAGTYDVTLIAANPFGTSTLLVINLVTVYDIPVTSFTSDVDTVCWNMGGMGQVQFTSISTNTTSYSWDFGDLGSSTAQDPSHTYTSAGSYTVTLTTSNLGCSTQTTSTIYVETCTGIEEGVAGNMSLVAYPNPFNDLLQVGYALKNLGTDATMSLFDVTGRELTRLKISSTKGTIAFDDNLAKGIYFVKLYNGVESTVITRVVRL